MTLALVVALILTNALAWVVVYRSRGDLRYVSEALDDAVDARSAVEDRNRALTDALADAERRARRRARRTDGAEVPQS